MEVDQSEDTSCSGDGVDISPAEQLKTKLSGGGGDTDAKLCNGDAKRVNGQNGNHGDEAMDTDDMNGSKDGEDTTDSKVEDVQKKDPCDGEKQQESSDEESEAKQNGTDSNGRESKGKDIDSEHNEDSKSSADDNKENESVKSDVGSKIVTEDDSSQEKKLDDKSKSEESTVISNSAPGSPSADKKESSGDGEEKSAAELEKELKKNQLTEEEKKQAEEVDQREKKLKRIEDAAKDNDDLRPVAKLLYGIGMDLGAQHIYKDLVRAQTKKQTMNKLDKRGRDQLTKLKETYKKLTKRNKAYHLRMRSCEKCGFKTESKNVIEWHLEFAHGQDEGKYECSLCAFETRLPAPFFFHMEAEHNRKGRVFMKKAFFSCPQCPYENNSKNAVARHRQKCDKQFSLKRNQEPLPTDCDIPLKKPKSIITKRVQPAAKPATSTNLQLKGYLDQRGPQQSPSIRPVTSVVRVNHPNPTVQTILSQQQARSQLMNQSAMSNPRARIVTQNAANSTGAARPTTQQIQGPGGQMYTLVNSLMVQQLPQAYTTTIVPQVRPQGQQGATLQYLQSPQQQQGQQQAQPQNISQIAQQVVAQVTQQHNAAQQQKAIQDILKRAQQVPPTSTTSSRPNMPMTDAQAQAAAANNPKFEICEICGGFVKDRESLRIHFYWAHKVDIQKDVFARLNPHLKCDSCPQAFWTYQGLARHRQISHVKPRERSYRCYLCGAKNIENIITHLSAAHNVKLNTMYKTGKCLVCGLGFAGEKGLKRHIHTAHLELLKGTPDVNLGPSSKPPTQSPSPSTKPIQHSMLKASPGAGSKSADVVPTGLFENSAKKKKFEPVCSLCNIVFPSVESFTLHCNKLHVFKCWRCSDKWASAELLHKHWNEKHRHEMDQCSLCSERVMIGRPTIRHMKRSHLKDCSVVLIRMKESKLKFYLDKLNSITKTAKTSPPKDAEVIVLESDDEDVQVVQPKPVSTAGQDSAPTDNAQPTDKTETPTKTLEASHSKPFLKSGEKEVMEVDGEKIVVEVSQDEDDEEEEETDAQNKNDQSENSNQTS